ncbi:MAG TPA: DUF1440 domain-containing protein [Methylomirabilota bacterium]|nr:DUF1440 domain-containing protein [Methylomirabilota bacterium]
MSLRLAVYGALGGLNGAGCMSVLRLAARRAGLIERMAPQVVEDWAISRTGLEPPGGAAGRHVADHILHLVVGVLAGAGYGAVARASRTPSLPTGALFGVVVWATAFGLVAPALGITRPIWRQRLGENIVNATAHALFGIATALTTEELAGQLRRGTSAWHYRMRVG